MCTLSSSYRAGNGIILEDFCIAPLYRRCQFCFVFLFTIQFDFVLCFDCLFYCLFVCLFVCCLFVFQCVSVVLLVFACGLVDQSFVWLSFVAVVAIYAVYHHGVCRYLLVCKWQEKWKSTQRRALKGKKLEENWMGGGLRGAGGQEQKGKREEGKGLTEHRGGHHCLEGGLYSQNASHSKETHQFGHSFVV